MFLLVMLPSIIISPLSPISELNIHFDGGYVFDELGESIFEDSVDWGKLGSYYNPLGNQRIIVQLCRQFHDIELHSRRHLRCKRPTSSLVQPLLYWSLTSLPECTLLSFSPIWPFVPSCSKSLFVRLNMPRVKNLF